MIGGQRQRIVFGCIIDAEHDDGPRLGPQGLWVAAPFGGAGEPAHVAVIAAGDKFAQPVAGLAIEVGRGKPDRVKAQRQRPLADRLADRVRGVRGSFSVVLARAGIQGLQGGSIAPGPSLSRG